MKCLTFCYSIAHIVIGVDGFWLNEPITTTPLGRIVGSLMYSASGRRFQSFRGIPYALPPVGKLRFKVVTSLTFPFIGSWHFGGWFTTNHFSTLKGARVRPSLGEWNAWRKQRRSYLHSVRQFLHQNHTRQRRLSQTQYLHALCNWLVAVSHSLLIHTYDWSAVETRETATSHDMDPRWCFYDGKWQRRHWLLRPRVLPWQRHRFGDYQLQTWYFWCVHTSLLKRPYCGLKSNHVLLAGFISTEDSEAPGNYGLLDQATALK